MLRATYAAAAARISCLFALVNRDRTAENASVETSSIPMQIVYARGV